MEVEWPGLSGANCSVCNQHFEVWVPICSMNGLTKEGLSIANRTAYCLANKGISILELSVWRSYLPKDVIDVSFEDYHGSLFTCL